MEFKNFYDYYNKLSELLYREDWISAETCASLISIRDKHSDLEFLQVFLNLS